MRTATAAKMTLLQFAPKAHPHSAEIWRYRGSKKIVMLVLPFWPFNIVTPHVIRLSISLLFAVPLFGSSTACCMDSTDSTMLSPSGTFSIKFIPIGRNLWANDQPMEASDSDFFNIKYSVSITNRKTGKSFRSTYYDIHGTEPPMQIAQLASYFVWSPSEDFVLFPEEGWPRAPGAPTHTVLNLNPNFPWKEVKIRMEPTSWLDKLTIIGNSHEDCDFSVAVFDGRSGTVTLPWKSQSPIGYSLAGLHNGKVVVETVLDNCSSQDDYKNFRANRDSVRIDELFKRLRRAVH